LQGTKWESREEKFCEMKWNASPSSGFFSLSDSGVNVYLASLDFDSQWRLLSWRGARNKTS
jgi:hypothetical protein